MNSNQILKSDVLDIIFENKNKLYGAYQLRKTYNERLVKAMLLSLLILSALIGLSFIPRKNPGVLNTKGEVILTSPSKGPEKPIEQDKNKPDQRKNETQKTKPTQKANVNFVLVNKPPDKIDTITDYNPIIDFGPKTQPGEGPDDGKVKPVPQGGGDGDGSGKKDPPVIQAPQGPLTVADVYPEYPGGIEALQRFLERHLTNPRDLEENEVVTVHVKFVVGEDGKLKSFDVVKDGGKEFNEEVIRVLKKMPDWKPGKSNGKDVAVYRIIPVKFTTQE